MSRLAGAVDSATQGDAVALAAAAVALATTVVLVVVVVLLTRRVRELGSLVDALRVETVPLVRDARVVVDQAASEMERVGDVLGSAEAVSATVDSASRLAYRAFANPVVKSVAFASGFDGALRRLFGRSRRTAASDRDPSGRLAPRATAATPSRPLASPGHRSGDPPSARRVRSRRIEAGRRTASELRATDRRRDRGAPS